MIIPWQQLTPETLNNLIESYVLREGTDYGLHEKTLQTKVNDVVQQLKQGIAIIVWSELHESVSIVPAHQFQEKKQEGNE